MKLNLIYNLGLFPCYVILVYILNLIYNYPSPWSMVRVLESLTYPVTYLAWVRYQGYDLVVWRGGKESSTGYFQERWLENYPPI